jgi:hypothetical protein
MSDAADSWSCTISLRLDQDAPPVAFGPPIADRNDVELWLCRAQAAILSIRDPPPFFFDKSKEFLKMYCRSPTRDTSQPNIMPFTGKAVVVEIKDPNATNLSFHDLPGK